MGTTALQMAHAASWSYSLGSGSTCRVDLAAGQDHWKSAGGGTAEGPAASQQASPWGTGCTSVAPEVQMEEALVLVGTAEIVAGGTDLLTGGTTAGAGAAHTAGHPMAAAGGMVAGLEGMGMLWDQPIARYHTHAVEEVRP